MIFLVMNMIWRVTNMKSYKLHESFRKFLKESQEFKQSETGIVVVDYGNKKAVILYNPKGISKMSSMDIRRNEHFQAYELIGAITVKNTMITTNEPCIPKTYEVASIFVEKNYRGMGFQKILMDQAFRLTSKEGAGLTSDHKYGTKAGAAGAWDKIEKSSQYTKKTTKAGNDTFDYNDSTPDQEDDCAKGSKDPVATDHSFIRTSLAGAENKFDLYSGNHRRVVRKLEFAGGESYVNNFENVLGRMAAHRFNQLYHMDN